jgi:outer membrane protein OmpA-like peptidoglycan-associated protein
MAFTNDSRCQRRIGGLALSVILLSGAPVYGYEDYPYDGYRDGGYEGSRASQQPLHYSYSDPLPQSRPMTNTPQGTPASGAPFGLSKSAAGAITGALLGAASGAIIGSKKGDAGPGAAIGAGVGAVSGYLVGRQIEGRDQALDTQQQRIEQQRQEIARNRALLEELKRRNLDARETERGVVVNLPNVLFEFNSARLTADARSKVAHIATALNRQAAGRRVSVEGHADAIGSEAYNLILSQNRAESVAREISYAGVSEAHLTTRGYGKKYPVAPNTHADGSDNPAGRAQNRRVEVVIEN